MTVRASRVGGRIHLTSAYSPHVVTASNKIAGANWSKRARAWTFPLTIETCIRLRQEFGSQLVIRRSLAEWYIGEAARRAELNALTSSDAVALPIVEKRFPILHEAVAVARPYQAVGAQFIIAGRAVILADDPGLGKTLEVLAAVAENELRGPYLVVSPKIAATSVWPYAVPRWCPGQDVAELPEGRAERDAVLNDIANKANKHNLNNTWVCVHPEAVMTKSFWDCSECGQSTLYTRKPTPRLGCGHRKPRGVKVRNEHVFPQLFGIHWGAIICDESHESLVMKTGTPTQRRRGMDLLRLREDGLRVAASGTPWRSKPEQLWGTLNWLWPKKYSSKWNWIRQYWEVGGYSGWQVGKIIPEREKMLWDEIASIMIRRTKAEVAPDLPPKIYMGTPLDPSDDKSPVGIWLPMEGKQARAYRQMHEGSAAEVENGSLNANGVLAELTRLRQLASAYGKFDALDQFMPNPPSNKMDWVEQWLIEHGFPDEPCDKVVIVSRYTKLLNMLSFGLAGAQGGNSCMLTGELSGPRRKKIIDEFNRPVGTNSPHIMFLQVKAGGVAITIDSADHMIILDESDPDAMTQVEDRLHRVSNPRPVFISYLRSVGTVDVGTAVVNSERAAEGRRLADERRGVKYLIRVLEASVG